MALTRTTLSAAVADANDTSISVTSATGFSAGSLVKVDAEFMVVQQSYVSGTLVPVRRGQLGSKSVAHVVTAPVTVGATSGVSPDWAGVGFAEVVQFPTAGRARYIQSITAATSTLTGLVPGSDTVVVLNGSVAITLTIPIPTKDMDGDLLYIISTTGAAHIPTFTGGVGGAGTSYDAFTFNSTGTLGLVAMACNAVWVLFAAPGLTGTVTNITAGVA